MRVQLVAGLPQVDGDTAAPIEPTDGTTDMLSLPVPPMVKGKGGELMPPTIVTPCGPDMVGGGIIASAPSASTRP